MRGYRAGCDDDGVAARAGNSKGIALGRGRTVCANRHAAGCVKGHLRQGLAGPIRAPKLYKPKEHRNEHRREQGKFEDRGAL